MVFLVRRGVSVGGRLSCLVESYCCLTRSSAKMDGVETKPSLSLGLVQMMQQSVQHQQMTVGGQVNSLQPLLSSGSSLSDPIQVCT